MPTALELKRKYGLVEDDIPQDVEQDQRDTEEVEEDALMRSTGGSLVMETFRNIPGSAYRFGMDMLNPVLHPIKTAVNLYELGSGIVQLAMPGEQGNEEVARQVGQFFLDRYGSKENIVKTITEDPVGFLGDIALVASGTGVGIRATGTATKAADFATKVGRYTDPTLLGAKTIKGAADVTGKGLSTLSGTITGTGPTPLRVAAQGGKGKEIQQKTFDDALTGKISEADILREAQEGLQSLKSEKGEIFERKETDFLPKMERTKVNPEVRSRMENLIDVYRMENVVAKGAPRDQILKRMERLIKDKDRKIDTVADLDVLRQELNQLKAPLDNADAMQAYSSIRKQVADTTTELAPQGYKQFLDDYSDAAAAVEDVVKELSVGRARGSRQTAVNKLLSTLSKEKSIAADVLRTMPNYDKLLSMLSGYVLSAPLPTGLSRSLTTALLPGAGLTASGAALATGNIIPGLIGLAAVSPRLAGGTAYRGGQLRRGIASVTPNKNVAGLLRQVGAQQDEQYGTERQGLL